MTVISVVYFDVAVILSKVEITPNKSKAQGNEPSLIKSILLVHLISKDLTKIININTQTEVFYSKC